ncbi:hypothetical protein I3842_04G080400 [Carya illinoinensis]|uniref:Fe2OG dioxygenase domain-containing protein n=1 Tax=Carya illinoinensis TaxID=32201 RepID=A0A922FC60_CARIL|nr:hypothetical protein I3842_04G080400 [Carya illinoinensis]
MSLIMDSSTSPPINPLCPLMDVKDHENGAFVFDSALLQKQTSLPSEFIWPLRDLANHSSTTREELKEPIIDLGDFITGENNAATARAVEHVREACLNHGFFQVTNHGVDVNLIRAAYDEIDTIFKMPLDKKLSLCRKPGCISGYSGAHADRYSSKLPWKETFSFGYHENDDDHDSEPMVVNYFNSILGEDFQRIGWVYQRYCEAMKEVSLVIMELLAISLGVDRLHYRKFFEDGSSIMRCNYYPPCKKSGLTLGTGPHCDPTSLTILHQDQVGGLEVFANNQWHSIRPRPDALVINIGDTFMALSNGKYKSCLHRAVVNRDKERRSLVYFVCPREDKVVRPPKDLVCGELGTLRNYPDFTWSDLLEFTLNHYRADVATLQSFIQWLVSSKPSNNF